LKCHFRTNCQYLEYVRFCCHRLLGIPRCASKIKNFFDLMHRIHGGENSNIISMTCSLSPCSCVLPTTVHIHKRDVDVYKPTSTRKTGSCLHHPAFLSGSSHHSDELSVGGDAAILKKVLHLFYSNYTNLVLEFTYTQ
jgi:hypothetical protein